MKAGLLVVCMSLMLSACSAPTVPDVTYFRLPPPAQDLLKEPPHLPLPVDVSIFSADGLYSEQALIYTLDDAGRVLRSYHYQLWADPPARLLQRRLIALLRRAEAAPLVTDRLPASADAVRISGLILRFDRLKQGAGFNANVALQLRVERSGKLLSEQVYRASVPAAGADVADSITAFGAALDQIYAQFAADLGRLKLEPAA